MRCRSVAFGFDSAYPLFRYAGTVRSAVLAYKSGRRRSLASFFAQAIAGVLESRYPGRVVVPVPPRPGKRRRKGWDQVEDIAGILERRHGVTVARVLVRADGLEQKALDLEGRAANMRGRIRVKDRLAPRKLLGRPRTCGSAAGTVPVPRAPVLLDDVLTTGATLSACASALKAAGAARVDAVAIAAD
jgi:predicted amidophosphoribosyltransferase